WQQGNRGPGAMDRNYDVAHTIFAWLIPIGWLGSALGIVGTGRGVAIADLSTAIYSAGAAVACVCLVASCHVGRAVLSAAVDVEKGLAALREAQSDADRRARLTEGTRRD